jgi:hypothetical protein
MSGTKSKRFYVTLDSTIIEEMQQECARLDGSISWVARMAMRIALPVLRQSPGVETAAERLEAERSQGAS